MSTKKEKKEHILKSDISRRRFLQVSGAAATAVGVCPVVFKSVATAQAGLDQHDSNPDPVWSESDVVRTVCLMCHSACGLQVRVKDGIIRKVDGNPYHPNCMEPDERPPWSTDPTQLDDSTYPARGRSCPKAQAAPETIYDPWRLTTPLKRVGSRGSGQWEKISWADAIEEIRSKLQTIYDSTDSNDWNKLLFVPGRLEHGQKEFTDRWFGKGFGTVNKRHDHTSICETSHHVGFDLLTGRTYPKDDGQGKKNHFKPDLPNCEYVIFFGANPLEAGFPMNALSRKLTNAKAAGTLKYVVVDPRLSNSAGKADKWVPIVPGADAALALAMVKQIIDGAKYDAAFLANSNFKAAQDDDETTWTDATHLIVTDAVAAGGTEEFPAVSKGVVLRRKHLEGVSAADSEHRVCVAVGAGTSGTLAYNDSAVQIFAPKDTGVAVEGELFFDGTITDAAGRSIPVRTALKQVKDAVNEKTAAEYSAICGVSESDISTLASDFTSHGKKAAVEMYRGPVQQTNGTLNAMAVGYLNMLVGNIDHQGGVGVGGGHLHEDGSKKDGQLKIKEVDSAKNPRSASGVQLSRVKEKYEDNAADFGDEWPAKRPWFPYAYNGNYQEILPSIEDQYPYAIEALFTYWADIPYSTPAAKAQAEKVLADETKLPFHVCFDIQVSEISKWADIILPDATWLERFSTPHVAPMILTATSGFRRPIVGSMKESGGTKYFTPYNGSGNVAQDASTATGPQLLEDILIALGKALSADFAAVGADTFPATLKDGSTETTSNANFTRNLDSAWDWYKNILENYVIEIGDSGATADVIMQKGGWFEAPGAEYSEVNGKKYLHHTYGDHPGSSSHKKGLFFYVEALATTKDSMGDGSLVLNEKGVAVYEPTTTMEVQSGAHVEYNVDDASYPLTLVTYKPVFHAQGRTNVNPSLMAMKPENHVEMAKSDADALGVETGNKVKITSVGGSAEGLVLVTEGMKPGVVAIAHSFGHWETGAADYAIDGATVAGSSDRGAGLASSPLMRVDPWSAAAGAADVTLQDRIGGSSAFFATRVKVEKV